MIKTSFNPPIRTTMKKVRKDVNDELKGFGEDLLANVKSLTPFLEGRARRGWRKKISKDKVSLSNTVPYIERLNNNFSKQTKGKGIIKPAVRLTASNRKRRTR